MVMAHSPSITGFGGLAEWKAMLFPNLL